jgi:hypothetical protein
MEGQQNFSLSVNTFIERHVNVAELFNFSRLHVNNMAGILKDLDLVGSTTGLTIKDRYINYSIEGTFVLATRWVVIGLSILGLGGILLCLIRRYKKAKMDHLPLQRRFKICSPLMTWGPGTMRCKGAADWKRTRTTRKV